MVQSRFDQEPRICPLSIPASVVDDSVILTNPFAPPNHSKEHRICLLSTPASVSALF